MDIVFIKFNCKCNLNTMQYTNKLQYNDDFLSHTWSQFNMKLAAEIANSKTLENWWQNLHAYNWTAGNAFKSEQ